MPSSGLLEWLRMVQCLERVIMIVHYRFSLFPVPVRFQSGGGGGSWGQGSAERMISSPRFGKGFGWMTHLVFAHKVCHVAMPEHSCPPRGRLMQGWESELSENAQYLIPVINHRIIHSLIG